MDIVIEVVGFRETCSHLSDGLLTVELFEIGFSVSTISRQEMPISQITIVALIPHIFSNVDMEFFGDLVSNILELNCALTIGEFQITESSLGNSIVAIVYEDPSSIGNIVTEVDVLYDVPIVTIVVLIGRGREMNVSWSIPNRQCTITDITGVSLIVEFVVGHSEEIVPGIWFPIHPSIPSVNSVLESFTFESPVSRSLSIIEGLTSTGCYLFFNQEIISELLV